jgi:hypothetical protein
MNDRLLVLGKQVEFENGAIVSSAAFLAAKSTVTVSQYAEFTKATGYQTLAERKGADTYFDNSVLIDLSVEEQQTVPAMHVCYFDALEYCRWTKTRLPSETEWLAMAVCLEERLSHSAARDRFVCDGRWQLEEISRGLVLACAEITSTLVGDDRVVVRSGPKYYRSDKFEQDVKHNRNVIDLTKCDLLTSFRTVWDLPT